MKSKPATATETAPVSEATIKRPPRKRKAKPKPSDPAPTDPAPATDEGGPAPETSEPDGGQGQECDAGRTPIGEAAKPKRPRRKAAPDSNGRPDPAPAEGPEDVAAPGRSETPSIPRPGERSSPKGSRGASKGKRSKTPTRAEATDASGLTLAALAERYVRHLEDDAGKSASTCRSYAGDLAVAMGVLGADTPAASLTPVQVAAFNDSPAVTQTRTGEPKAPVTVAKVRRVLRMCLVWAAGAGLIPEAPIPASK